MSRKLSGAYQSRPYVPLCLKFSRYIPDKKLRMLPFLTGLFDDYRENMCTVNFKSAH